MTLVKLTEEAIAAEKGLSKIEKQAEAIQIKTSADIDSANEMMTQAKKFEKIIKLQREKFEKPAKEIVKQSKETYGPLQDQFKNVADILKGKILEAKARLQKEAEEKAAKIEARVGEGKGKLKLGTAMKKIGELDTPADQLIGQAGSTSFSKQRVAVVEDWNKIPAEYFTREKVREALMVEIRRDALGNKAQGIEPIEIPGVRIDLVDNLSVTV